MTKFIEKYGYTKESFKHVIPRYPTLANDKIPLEFRSVLWSQSDGFTWYLYIAGNITPYDVHEAFVDSFNEYTETGCQQKSMSIKMMNSMKGFPFTPCFYIKNINGEIIRRTHQYSRVMFLSYNKTNELNKLMFMQQFNFFSDYPRNMETGLFVDNTAVSKMNREPFNKGFQKFTKALNAEVRVALLDIKNIAKKLPNYMYYVEEMDENGFKALSERKAEYEKQQI